MRILFDQGTPVPLRENLKQHEVTTAHERGWSTLKNGELLDATERDGFEVFVTTDSRLRYQQNLAARRIAVVCLLKKEKFFLAGLALSYATLLRLFPGLMVVGPLLAGLEYLRVNKKLDPRFLKFVGGGALGCAVLIPLSLVLSGQGPERAPSGVITGVVKLAGKGTPIGAVPISSDATHRSVSDQHGNFRLEVSPGKQSIQLEPAGFKVDPFAEDVALNEQVTVTYIVGPPPLASLSAPPFKRQLRIEVSRVIKKPGPLDIFF